MKVTPSLVPCSQQGGYCRQCGAPEAAYQIDNTFENSPAKSFFSGSYVCSEGCFNLWVLAHDCYGDNWLEAGYVYAPWIARYNNHQVTLDDFNLHIE